jgi:hypothetical protein
MSAQSTPEPRRQAGTTHGVTSQVEIARRVRNVRRRILYQLRLSPTELDQVGRGYLALYCRLVAKIELADAYLEEHGLLQPDGEPQPVTKLYVSLVNSARNTLSKLESHLGERPSQLQTWLEGELADEEGP